MRLFVAFQPPQALIEALALLRGSLHGADWQPVQNYHVCLRFIGNLTDRHIIRDIDDNLARLSWKPFELTFSGAVIREGAAMDCLALGVERNPAFEALQSQVENLLRRAGCPPTKRRFQPHLTLAHIRTCERQAAIRWVQSHNLFRSKPVSIEHVTLFESLRGYEERLYVPQAEYAWNPAMQLSITDE